MYTVSVNSNDHDFQNVSYHVNKLSKPNKQTNKQTHTLSLTHTHTHTHTHTRARARARAPHLHAPSPSARHAPPPPVRSPPTPRPCPQRQTSRARTSPDRMPPLSESSQPCGRLRARAAAATPTQNSGAVRTAAGPSHPTRGPRGSAHGRSPRAAPAADGSSRTASAWASRGTAAPRDRGTRQPRATPSTPSHMGICVSESTRGKRFSEVFVC